LRHPRDLEWQAVLDVLPGFVAIADRERRIRLLNRPPLGRSLQDFLGMDFAEFVAPEHRALVIDAADQVLAGTPMQQLDCRSSATGRWHRHRAVGIVEQGTVVGFAIYVFDVDDEKRANADLIRLRLLTSQRDAMPAAAEDPEDFTRRFHVLADSLPMLLSYVDKQQRYQYNNPAYERWFDMPREQLRGRTVAEMLGPAAYALIRPHIEEALSGHAVSFETSIPYRGGGLRRVATHLVPDVTPDGDTQGFYGLVQDLSDRQMAATALRQREDELRQMQKMEALGRLANGIAHEFNNLLQTVVTGCTALLMSLGDREAAASGQVARMRRAAQRGTSLTRQLLTFSRNSEPAARELEIDDLLGDVHYLLDRLLGGQISLEIDLNCPCRIMADAGEIQQVLMNLVINARDAMAEGGRVSIASSRVDVSAETAAHPSGLQPGSYALLTVADTGSGMDEQTRARIFDPFFTTKSADKGTGLGLSTVYGIVQRLHGHVEVDSAPGQGTTFRLYFPCPG